MTNRPVITVLLPWKFKTLAKTVQARSKNDQRVKVGGNQEGMRVTATVQDFLRLGIARESYDLSDPVVGRLRNIRVPVKASRTVELPGGVSVVEVITGSDARTASKLAQALARQGAADLVTLYDGQGVGHTGQAGGLERKGAAAREAAWYDPRTWGKGKAPAQQAPAQQAPAQQAQSPVVKKLKDNGINPGVILDWDMASRAGITQEEWNQATQDGTLVDAEPITGNQGLVLDPDMYPHTIERRPGKPGSIHAPGQQAPYQWPSMKQGPGQQVPAQQGKAGVPTAAQQSLYDQVKRSQAPGYKQAPGPFGRQPPQQPRGASRGRSAAEDSKNTGLVEAIRNVWEKNGDDMAQLIDWDLSDYEAPEIQDVMIGVLPQYLTEDQLEKWNALEPEVQSKVMNQAFPRNAIKDTMDNLQRHYDHQTRGASRGMPRTLEACADPMDLGLYDPEDLVRVNRRGSVNDLFA